jgi:hypothetical protein
VPYITPVWAIGVRKQPEQTAKSRDPEDAAPQLAAPQQLAEAAGDLCQHQQAFGPNELAEHMVEQLV